MQNISRITFCYCIAVLTFSYVLINCTRRQSQRLSLRYKKQLFWNLKKIPGAPITILCFSPKIWCNRPESGHTFSEKMKISRYSEKSTVKNWKEGDQWNKTADIILMWNFIEQISCHYKPRSRDPTLILATSISVLWTTVHR